jgi:pimeloyl-ACP methyl ester carboxylesterase
VPAGAIRLHVRELRSVGRPLLLLHGLGVSGAVWQSFGRRLVPVWSPVAPDLRGHGASDKPPTGYAPDDYARDLAVLLDGLGTTAPVVGHSLGALAALALALRHPGRAPALVLVDPPLDAAIENTDVAPVFRLRREAPGALENYLVREDGHPPLVARSLAALFRQAADGPFQEHLASPPGAPWSWDAAPQIGVPVLVAQADPAGGGLLGDAVAQDFVSRLQHGRLVRFPGAPHAIHAAQPAQLAAAILEFLG